MGWWRTASGDVIGDPPADVVSADLTTISEDLLARRGQRLGLDELLGYLDLVLRTKAADLLESGANQQSDGIAAELELIDEQRSVPVAMTVPNDDAIRDRVDAMCAQISLAYEAELDRRPKPSELLGSIRFVLGHGPDQLLDLPPRSRVVAIRLVT